MTQGNEEAVVQLPTQPAVAPVTGGAEGPPAEPTAPTNAEAPARRTLRTRSTMPSIPDAEGAPEAQDSAATRVSPTKRARKAAYTGPSQEAVESIGTRLTELEEENRSLRALTRELATNLSTAQNSAGRFERDTMGQLSELRDAVFRLRETDGNLSQEIKAAVVGNREVQETLATELYPACEAFNRFMAEVTERLNRAATDASAVDSMVATVSDIQGQLRQLESRVAETENPAKRLRGQEPFLRAPTTSLLGMSSLPSSSPAIGASPVRATPAVPPAAIQPLAQQSTQPVPAGAPAAQQAGPGYVGAPTSTPAPALAPSLASLAAPPPAPQTPVNAGRFPVVRIGPINCRGAHPREALKSFLRRMAGGDAYTTVLRPQVVMAADLQHILAATYTREQAFSLARSWNDQQRLRPEAFAEAPGASANVIFVDSL